MKPSISLLLSLGYVSLAYAIASNPAKAQIEVDGTTPTDITPGTNEAIITGGTNPDSGSNLFHSFSEFSVTPDNGAFFDNAANIQNIFSRVTGANPSSIDGLIRANDANLFLINPNGIVYGSNASLQLGGSFYGSTADSILFSDGEFSAVNPDNTPILTINAPIGLSFRDNPATIDVRATAGDGTGVQITSGETLGFFGGDIILDGSTIIAPGGIVELGGLTAAGTIEIAEIDNNFSFTFPEGVTRSNITLSNGAGINVAGADGGFINVNANNLTLSGASIFFAGIAEGSGSAEARGGDINLNATGNINLSGVSSLQNRVNSGATGNSGNVNVTANSLNITEGAFISASTLGIGDGGDINVTVDGAVTIDGFVEGVSLSRLASVVGNSAEGDGGDININADSLSLSNLGLINTAIFPNTVNPETGESIPGGRGNAGNITINATESLEVTGSSFLSSSTFGEGDTGTISIQAVNGSVELSGLSNIFNNVEFGGKGNSNGIIINAGSLSLLEGSQIQTLVREAVDTVPAGQGNAGNIAIDVDTAMVSGSAVTNINGQEATLFSQIASNVNQGAVGSGGNIQLTAKSLNLTEGGNITSSTAGIAGENGRSDAGDITVNVTESLEATGGSFLQSDTFGQGNAGNITINGENAAISFDGVGENNTSSGIFSSVRNFNGLIGNGTSGQIAITADSLSLNDGAAINNGLDSGVSGRGNNINLNADTVTISGSSTVTDTDGQEIPVFSSIASIVNQDAIGTGGGIQLTANSLNMTGGGNINTSTSGIEGENGRSDAGDITVNVTESLEATGGSFLQSDTFGQGDAGNITINGENAAISFDGVGENNTSSGIFSSVRNFNGFVGNGTSGQITITADSLSLNNGAAINNGLDSGVSGRGNNISLNADTVTISGSSTVTDADGQEIPVFSSIASIVNQDAIGTGGGIQLTANSLNMTGGGNINTSTAGIEGENGRSDAGDITINVTESLEATGGSFLQSDTFGQGDAGNITINGENAAVSFDGVSENGLFSGIFSAVNNFTDPITQQILVGQGAGGTIDLTANSLSLSNEAQINTSSIGEGDGGDITLRIDNRLDLRGNSAITATANSNNSGGNIDINAEFIVAFPSNNNGNDILANNLGSGNGGRINITVDEAILGIEERTPRPTTNDINADSGSGINGDVTINTPDANTIQGTTQLPENVVEPDSTVTQACSSIVGSGSTLTVKGKGNVTPQPTAPLNSDDIFVADNFDDEDVKSSEPVSIDDIVPAQGVVIREDGSIFLTPYPTSKIASRLSQNSECNVESDKVLQDDRRQRE